MPSKLTVLESEDWALWDKFVLAHPHSCYMQSSAWADFMELEGYQSFRYVIFAQDFQEGDFQSDSQLIGGAIFYLYANGDRANILYAPGAPLFLEGFECDGMALLLEVAKKIALDYGAIALRIEPLRSDRPIWMAEFSLANLDLMPVSTLLIDLTPPLETILARMKPKGRYNLRLAERYGVETEFTRDLQQIPKFYGLFAKTVDRKGFFGESYGFFINLCQTFFAQNLAEFGFATWQGEIIGTMLLIFSGDRAIYLYGGSSDRHRQVMAGYALHWQAIQRSKARGCKLYDFYGYSDLPEHNYFRFSQFKRQFGGSIVQTIGAYDYYFYDQLAEIVIELMAKIA
jgi:peptidoglycan pentaglycine glycine transferase (the first glycine)